MEVKLNKSNRQTNIDMYRVATLTALYQYVTGIGRVLKLMDFGRKTGL